MNKKVKEESKKSNRSLIIIISLIFMFGLKVLPTPAGMSDDGLHVLGIFIGSLLLWLFISIDWPSLLCIMSLAFVSGLNMKEILASSFGNTTFAFLLFSFMCTYSLSKTSFIKRIAVWFVTSSVAKKGPWHFTLSFFAAIVFIGCFISPTVLFVVTLPILKEIYKILELEKGDEFASMLMIGLVCCCGIASGMTPIGHVYGPLAIGFYEAATGSTINYVSYMGFAIPVGIIVTIVMFLIFRFIMRPNLVNIDDLNVDALRSEKEIGKDEKIILSIFGLVVFLWISPSFIEGFAPNIAEFISSKGIAFPPLVGVVLLSIITINGESLMNFSETMKKGVSWPALIMCAGTLALGAAMTNENVALTTYLSDKMEPFTTGLSPILLVAFFATWAAIQTNISSNIVTITVVANIAIPIVLSTNGAVSTPAVVSIIGMMGGYAFATPPAMPSVAIAGGSGWVSPLTMMKYGFMIMIVTIATTVLVGYPIAAALMGY